MKFRYSVKGIVEKAFILRGLVFEVNKPIDTYIGERELDFIKSHCKLTQLVDLEMPINSTTKTIPNNSVKKGVENNELPKQQQTTRTDKAKISRKV